MLYFLFSSKTVGFIENLYQMIEVNQRNGNFNTTIENLILQWKIVVTIYQHIFINMVHSIILHISTSTTISLIIAADNIL